MDKRNIGRWIYSSIAKHFGAYATQATPLYIEGQTPKEPTIDRAELRVNGPFFSHPVKNEWYLDVEVNLLLSCGLLEQDVYKVWAMIGQYIEAFSDSIEVFKYGDGPTDNGDSLGCLILQHDRGDDILLTHFGQVDPNVRVVQSSLNALYNMCLFGPLARELFTDSELELGQTLGEVVD